MLNFRKVKFQLLRDLLKNRKFDSGGTGLGKDCKEKQERVLHATRTSIRKEKNKEAYLH